LTIVALLLAAGRLCSQGQSNVPPSGVRARVANYDPSWLMGSPASRFGLEQCGYCEDASGFMRPITNSGDSSGERNISRHEGGVQRTYTSFFFLGQVLFCVPLPKEVVAFAVLLVLLVTGFWIVMAATHIRDRLHDTSRES
jgi:hypothetical protein